MAFVKQFLGNQRCRKGSVYCGVLAAAILVSTLHVSAQVRPPRRKHRIMVDPQAKQEKPRSVNIGANLRDIAKRATQHAENSGVDVVFVVDGGRRMAGHLVELEKQVVNMLAVVEAKTMDYRFALVSFHAVHGEPKVDFHKWTFDYLGIETALRDMRVGISNNIESGYGLDAVMQTLNELDFREAVTTQFILVTNSRMRTSWTEAKGKNKISRQLIDLCRKNNVQLNCIGVSEKVQAELTDETGGMWYPIDSNQRQMDGQRIRSGETIADKALLRVDGLFKRIAENLVASNPGKVDVVFVFDYSLSMETKTEAACEGLDLMVSVFKGAGLDYRFGIIRFWAAVGGGESTIVVTKPPLAQEQVKSLFRLPKIGDEHLLDAIIEGVPKLRTESERDLVLIIVTDESTSRRPEKGYTAGRAISTCRGVLAKVYVIGGVTSMRSGSMGDNFQRQVAQLTKGEHYIMPGSTIADERR